MTRRLRITSFAGIVAAIFVAALSSPALSQDIWGLRSGDVFKIETIISQETSLSLDGADPVLKRWTERLETAYRKLPVASTDLFEVRILQASRNRSFGGSSARLDLAAAQPAIRLEIDETGQAKLSSELSSLFGDREDDQTRTLLQSIATPEVFVSWISTPFWMAPPEAPAVDLEWQREHVMSLGPLGTMNTDVTCRIRDFIDSEATVKISGVGTVSDEAASAIIDEQLGFEDITAKLTEFDGRGTFVVPDDPPKDARIRLPWFKELRLHWTIEGTAMIRAGKRMVPVRFTHDQQQTSKILSTGFRRQNFLRGAPVIPLPQ